MNNTSITNQSFGIEEDRRIKELANTDNTILKFLSPIERAVIEVCKELSAVSV